MQQNVVEELELRLDMADEQFRYLPLREAVYGAVKKAILDGSLAPGRRLTSEKLAEQLGVSRMPVREALRKLENEGFVSVYAGRYIEVASIRREELLEEYALREAIEGLAARLAAKHRTEQDIETMRFHAQRMRTALEKADIAAMVAANDDFHAVLFEATRNRKIKEVMNLLWKSMHMLSGKSLRNRTWAEEAVNEHLELVAAIDARDGEMAETLSREHVRNAERALPEMQTPIVE